MRVISTNTGEPKSYEFKGATVTTSMRRSSQPQGIQVTFDRVIGDKFAVEKAHGTRDAVVYAFSASAFEGLSQLYTQPVGIGNVGENLTIDALDESEFMIGDEYEVGTTRLKVSGPRYPCNRLNFCFQREGALEMFAEYRRPGVYFEVLREGTIRAGDELKHVKSAGGNLSVLQLFDHLKALKDMAAGRLTRDDVRPICEKVAADSLVPEMFRSRFRKLL